MQYEDRVTAQIRGTTIRNCGDAGNSVDSALTSLDFFFSDQYGVLVDCRSSTSPDCVKVQIDVPADTTIVDIDICDLGK